MERNIHKDLYAVSKTLPVSDNDVFLEDRQSFTISLYFFGIRLYNAVVLIFIMYGIRVF